MKVFVQFLILQVIRFLSILYYILGEFFAFLPPEYCPDGLGLVC